MWELPSHMRVTFFPFLEGVCLGMQLAVVEFSRNVLRGQDANSTEFDPNTSYRVVIDIPEHNTGQMGGTMRLGKRRTLFQTKNSVMSKLFHMSLAFVLVCAGHVG